MTEALGIYGKYLSPARNSSVVKLARKEFSSCHWAEYLQDGYLQQSGANTIPISRISELLLQLLLKTCLAFSNCYFAQKCQNNKIKQKNIRSLWLQLFLCTILIYPNGFLWKLYDLPFQSSQETINMDFIQHPLSGCALVELYTAPLGDYFERRLLTIFSFSNI